MTLQVSEREPKTARTEFAFQPKTKAKLRELVTFAKAYDQRASMTSVVESLIMQAKVRK